MNIKALFCKHEWEEVDTKMFTIIVVCTKCKSIASMEKAIKLLQANEVKRLG
jgi:hypothetical protein